MRRSLAVALTVILVLYQLIGVVQPALAGGTITITGSGAQRSIGTLADGSVRHAGQSITALSGRVTQLTFTFFGNSGSPTGTATWEIYDDSSNLPGTLLQSGTFTPVPMSTVTVPVISGITMTAGAKYWVVLRSTVPQAAGSFWSWLCSSTSTYAGGDSILGNIGGAWSHNTTQDSVMSITTVDPTPTPTPSNTPTPTYTPSNTPTPTYTPSNTPTPTFTPTDTFTPSNTPTDTLTPSDTPTATLTPSQTFTPSNTPTDTLTPSNTPTDTPGPSPTQTDTPTPSFTPTNTPTPTLNIFIYSTLSSGQAVAIEFRATQGQQIIVALIIYLIVLLLIWLFLRLRKPR